MHTNLHTKKTGLKKIFCFSERINLVTRGGSVKAVLVARSFGLVAFSILKSCSLKQHAQSFCKKLE